MWPAAPSYLSPKLSVYSGSCKERHREILIIVDSIIYCLPGAKVAEIIELFTVLIDLHPTAHSLIFHVGTNNLMSKQSVILHDHLESLAITVQSLGKTCIYSGPVSAPSKSPEHFSRLYSLHEWLKCLCTATGHGFISNFDSLWTRLVLYKPDGLHPNMKGVRQLTQNFIQLLLVVTDAHFSMTLN